MNLQLVFGNPSTKSSGGTKMAIKRKAKKKVAKKKVAKKRVTKKKVAKKKVAKKKVAKKKAKKKVAKKKVAKKRVYTKKKATKKKVAKKKRVSPRRSSKKKASKRGKGRRNPEYTKAQKKAMAKRAMEKRESHAKRKEAWLAKQTAVNRAQLEKLRKIKKQYKDGDITKAQYDAEAKKIAQEGLRKNLAKATTKKTTKKKASSRGKGKGKGKSAKKPTSKKATGKGKGRGKGRTSKKPTSSKTKSSRAKTMKSFWDKTRKLKNKGDSVSWKTKSGYTLKAIKNPFLKGANMKLQKYLKHDLAEAGGLFAGSIANQAINEGLGKLAPQLALGVGKVFGKFSGSVISLGVGVAAAAGADKIKNQQAANVAKGMIGSAVVALGATAYEAIRQMTGGSSPVSGFHVGSGLVSRYQMDRDTDFAGFVTADNGMSGFVQGDSGLGYSEDYSLAGDNADFGYNESADFGYDEEY